MLKKITSNKYLDKKLLPVHESRTCLTSSWWIRIKTAKEEENFKLRKEIKSGMWNTPFFTYFLERGWMRTSNITVIESWQQDLKGSKVKKKYRRKLLYHPYNVGIEQRGWRPNNGSNRYGKKCRKFYTNLTA